MITQTTLKRWKRDALEVKFDSGKHNPVLNLNCLRVAKLCDEVEKLQFEIEQLMLKVI